MPTLTKAQIDSAAVTLAREYLLGLPGVTEARLEKYLTLTTTRTRPDTVAGIYHRLLHAAQNQGMAPSVIGKAIGGVDNLGAVLCGFDPRAVAQKYAGQTWKHVLAEIRAKLRPKGRVRRTTRSLWPRYCRAILSGAAFMSQFSTAADFYDWADHFHEDARSRPALPMLLAHELDGIGFALACDFLKELGYAGYAKPDVHIRRIFRGLKLCSDKPNEYELFKAVIRVAENAGLTAYATDKLFWLIGSGRFHDDGLFIGRHGERFIKYARKRLA